MQVRIKRIDETLPMPAYQTKGAVAFDIYARETVAIPAGGLNRIPANLIVAIPSGYALIISSRSSLAQKKGLMLGNGIGIIDQDFQGPNDELLISVYNFTNTEVTVNRGDRIAQGMFTPISRAEFLETKDLLSPNRSGYGSTGGYKNS